MIIGRTSFSVGFYGRQNRLTRTANRAIMEPELNTLDKAATLPIDVFFIPNTGSARNIIPTRGITLHHFVDVFSSRCQFCKLVAYKQSDKEMNNLISNQDSLVSIKHNTVITTSKQIAITFGKRHDNVLADIRDIVTTVPTNFTALNFKESTYRDNSGKSNPIYELTRDGFTLLAMGFTGKRALEFKLAYINAFNEMERKLSEPKTITVRAHTRKLPTRSAMPKRVFDPVACGLSIDAQALIAGHAYDFICGAKTISELATRRDYLMSIASNGYTLATFRLCGQPDIANQILCGRIDLTKGVR